MLKALEIHTARNKVIVSVLSNLTAKFLTPLFSSLPLLDLLSGADFLLNLFEQNWTAHF